MATRARETKNVGDLSENLEESSTGARESLESALGLEEAGGYVPYPVKADEIFFVIYGSATDPMLRKSWNYFNSQRAAG